jgi:D-lactate dehydrogenase (cytochrome)
MHSKYTYNHLPVNITALVQHATRHNIEHSSDPTIRDNKANTPHSPAQPNEIPAVVFFPKTTEETSILLKECNEKRIAVTSFGAGTSFGGALTSNGGICISFERMQKIVALRTSLHSRESYIF